LLPKPMSDSMAEKKVPAIGDGAGRDDRLCLQRAANLGLLQEEHAPAVDGVARDVEEGAECRPQPASGRELPMLIAQRIHPHCHKPRLVQR
jgi:hypothetical protein